MSGSSIWPILHYDDTQGALRYLVEVLGFEKLVVATDDVGDVAHAELGWPGGGVVVFGSTSTSTACTARCGPVRAPCTS